MPRPNIVFFTCHDLGRYLGCFGHATVSSPSLDALAASGVRFDCAFCTAPQCSPSRASMHTGLYPHSSGMLGLAHEPFGWRLSPGVRHIARILSDAGYRTVLVGMQHLTERDRAGELGYGALFPVSPAREEAVTAVEILRAHDPAGQPLYLEIGFEEPHRPYDFGGTMPDASKGVEVPAYLPNVSEAREDFAALQGAVTAMDSAVGTVLAALGDLGTASDTLVVFATDHGVAMPRAKATLYDPGIEIAMLMRWPSAGLSGGRAVPELISNVDVTPTLLGALGIALRESLQGRSFWPLLQGAQYDPRSEIFAEKTFHTYYEPMRCIRTATHKYIANFEVSTAVDVPADVRQSPVYPLVVADFAQVRAHEELYDLGSDPDERTNIAGRPDAREVQGDLRGRLLSWMESTDDPLLRGPVASPYYFQTLRLLKG